MSDYRHFQPNPPHRLPCASVRDDLHAWALGALDRAEREQIDLHLETCENCRAEADRWLLVSTALPRALKPIAPPDAVKHQLMHRIADDQMRRVTPSLPTNGPSSTAAASTPPPRFRPSWSQMLIAPLIVALIAMSGWAFDLRDQVDTLEAGGETTSTAETMLPEGVQAFSMKKECEKCSGAGRVLANPHTATALFVAWNLDPSMIHEVWCVENDGSRKMVASLSVSASGDVVPPILFDDPIEGYSEIYVMSRDDGDKQVMEMNETPMSTPPPDPDEEQR